MDIEYGDLLAIRGSGWLSDQIDASTGNGGISHIAVVTADSPFVQVTEALGHGITVRSYEVRLAESQHLWVLKSPLSAADRAEACRICLSHVGESYGYGNIIWQELDDLARSRWWTEHMVSITHDLICSELATLAEAKLGLRPDDTTPNDLFAWWTVERWEMVQVK